MSLISKQASSENGSFYVLQSPNSKGPHYHIGRLFLEEKSTESRLGFFTTYDKSYVQSLGPLEAKMTANVLRLYLEKEASSAELRLNPSLGLKSDYVEAFEDIKSKMIDGNLHKAVLFSSSVLEDSDFPSRADYFAHCVKLLKNQKSGYLFGFYNPLLRKAYLGVTPEFLCRQQNGVKYTTAVAGTKTSKEAEKQWSEKLTKEHELVKTGIQKNYQIEWSDTSIQKYGNLRHLKAEGLLKTNDTVDEVSARLHPTSAVGTLPHSKSYGLRLGDLSLKDRGHFGGYVYLGLNEEPFSLVTIRGIEWSNNRSIVCIGGGVLPESLLDDEWSELENKWKTFKSLLES